MKDPIEDIDFLYKLRPHWNFYVDDEIFSYPKYNNKNIALLLEAKSIVPHLYDKFLGHPGIFESYRFVMTHDKSLLSLHEKMRYAPMGMTWIKNPSIRRKTKLVSMIASNKVMCDGHRYRISWRERLQGQVDIFGRDLKPIENKETGLDDYMFSVAMENASYSGYFTEKIIDCFATGTIPIYWGDPDIGDIFDANGIIKLTEDFTVDSLTPQLYKSKIQSVINNFEISKGYWSIQDNIFESHLKELQ
jgi:hypothetical protein